MTRYNLTREQQHRRAAARRENALAKANPGESPERVAPSGPTSFPIKARNAELDAMVQDFINRGARK